MWLELRWIAILLTLAIQTQTIAYAADTQSKRFPEPQDIRVVSVTPDSAGNFVLLNTQRSKQLPFPTIRYMPSPDGRSIMTVDFAGTTYQAPQSVLNFDNSAVKQIRIGQVQQYPPIMRISMLSDRKETFGHVDFRSAPGTLTIRLPAAETQPKPYEQAVMPKPAPEIVRKPAVANAAPDAVYLPWTEDKKPAPAQVEQKTEPAQVSEPAEKPQPGRFKRWFKKLFADDDGRDADRDNAPEAAPSASQGQTVPKPAPNIPRKQPPKQAPKPAPNALTSQPQIAPTAVKGVPLRITNANLKDKFNLTIAAPAKFNYRSFRLSGPERLVIDITGLDQPAVQVDDVVDNPLVKGLRIGNPDQNPLITRVVLDLATPQIADTAVVQDPPAATALNIILQKSDHAPVLTDMKPVRAGTTLVLDAGHGGSDPGAQRGDIQEKAITLEITEKLRKALESRGVKVHMTRSDDTFVSLEDRVKITNTLNPDAFVSIHINSLETNASTTGIETYYQNEQSKDLAKFIHQSLVAGLGAPDRGVRKARFYVINHTPVPAILAEVGFISSKEERDKLISSDYQHQIASAVADGVILFLSDRSQGQFTAANPAQAGSAGASGTIPSTAPSAPAQSFTQNLHSAKAKNQPEKRTQASSHQGSVAVKPKEVRKTKLAQQQLKFKKKRLAATRSL